MTSYCFQSKYSSKVTLHGGPVVLRPVGATPCSSRSAADLCTCCILTVCSCLSLSLSVRLSVCLSVCLTVCSFVVSLNKPLLKFWYKMWYCVLTAKTEHDSMLLMIALQDNASPVIYCYRTCCVYIMLSSSVKQLAFYILLNAVCVWLRHRWSKMPTKPRSQLRKQVRTQTRTLMTVHL